MHVKPKAETMDELYSAITSIQNAEECNLFLADLCTMTELMAMQQRLIVARLLKKGKIYSEIVAETGASTATISRVNRALTYGDGGYNTILDRMAQSK